MACWMLKIYFCVFQEPVVFLQKTCFMPIETYYIIMWLNQMQASIKSFGKLGLSFVFIEEHFLLIWNLKYFFPMKQQIFKIIRKSLKH